MKLDRLGPKPLYVQLSEIIQDKIMSGQWAAGSTIPSENVLAMECGVSKMTVRSVITQFVSEGLLYRVQGKGTFVAEPKLITQFKDYSEIRAQLEENRHEISTELIEAASIVPSGKIASQLQIPQGDPVWIIKRLRSVVKQPFSLHISYLPASLFPNIDQTDLEHRALSEVMFQDYNMYRGVIHETLESCVASPQEAQLFEIAEGSPLLMLKDVVCQKDGSPFEYAKIIFRGDRIKFTFDWYN